MATLESVVTRLANASLQRIEAFGQKKEILIDAQIKSEDAIQKLSESHERLAAARVKRTESQSRMDDQITIFAAMFERFIGRSMSNENDAMR